MADAGYSWSGWAAMTYNGGTPLTNVTLVKGAPLTADLFSLDGKAACAVEVTATAPDSAIDGDLNVATLEGAETIDDAVWGFALTLAQDNTRARVFPVDPSQRGDFEALLDNLNTANITVSLRVRTATVPAAS